MIKQAFSGLPTCCAVFPAAYLLGRVRVLKAGTGGDGQATALGKMPAVYTRDEFLTRLRAKAVRLFGAERVFRGNMLQRRADGTGYAVVEHDDGFSVKIPGSRSITVSKLDDDDENQSGIKLMIPKSVLPRRSLQRVETMQAQPAGARPGAVVWSTGEKRVMGLDVMQDRHLSFRFGSARYNRAGLRLAAHLLEAATTIVIE